MTLKMPKINVHIYIYIGCCTGLQSSRLVQGKGSNPLKVLIKENKVIYQSINQLNSGWCHTVIKF